VIIVGTSRNAVQDSLTGAPRYAHPVLRLITESVDPPALDTAVSTAILRLVGLGDAPPTLRLFVPRRSVAFGRQDSVNPGFPRAVDAARAAGFTPIERLAGGKAATFHEGTIAFAWAMPDDQARASITARFEAISAIVADALGLVGVDARVGEVPGEYCPGAYSVNARGVRKLMGVGQRLVRGATHVGGVVVAERSDLVNVPLIPAYAALGYAWDPAATGAVNDEVDTGVGEVGNALRDAFSRAGHDLVETPLDPAILSLARTLSASHEIA